MPGCRVVALSLSCAAFGAENLAAFDTMSARKFKCTSSFYDCINQFTILHVLCGTAHSKNSKFSRGKTTRGDPNIGRK